MKRVLEKTKDFSVVYKISSYELRVSAYNANSGAFLIIIFKDENDVFVKECVFSVEGDDFEKWGSDDGYLFELVDKNIHKILFGMDESEVESEVEPEVKSEVEPEVESEVV